MDHRLISIRAPLPNVTAGRPILDLAGGREIALDANPDIFPSHPGSLERVPQLRIDGEKSRRLFLTVNVHGAKPLTCIAEQNPDVAAAVEPREVHRILHGSERGPLPAGESRPLSRCVGSAVAPLAQPSVRAPRQPGNSS